MSIKITDWDPSEYLDNEESIEAYLNAAFEDGDPQLIASAIGDVARARGMTQIARDTGLAREALYRALSEKGNPELGTVIGVLKSLNLKIRVEPVAQQGSESVISILMPSPLYSTVSASGPFLASITANVSAAITIFGTENKGSANEYRRSTIGPAGQISSARIRTKVSSSGSPSTRTTLEHANRVT